jgi:aerobic-type carbon monoxide dehydrogenase small subunit (CoxS/CutS family)
LTFDESARSVLPNYEKIDALSLRDKIIQDLGDALIKVEEYEGEEEFCSVIQDGKKVEALVYEDLREELVITMRPLAKRFKEDILRTFIRPD